jgi:hypothetical protein
MLNHAEVITPRSLLRGAALLLALQLACLAATAATLLVPLALFALAFPLLAARLFGEHDGPTEFVTALASMAALAPLGGETCNGLAIALLLASTLACLAWQAMSVPSCKAEPRWT